MSDEAETPPMSARRRDPTLFAGRFRYLILVLGLIITTAISANVSVFSFTTICMHRDGLTDDSVSANATAPPYFTNPQLTALMWSTATSTLLSALPFTPMYARFGARAVLTVSGVASAALMLLFPLSVRIGIAAIFVIRFLQGITYAADFALMGVLCASWAPLSQVGLFVSTLSTYSPASSILANMISGFLCVSSFGWPAIYYGFGVVTLLLTLIWAYFYTEPAASRFVSTRELARIQSGKSDAHIDSETATRIPYKAILCNGVIWVIWLNAFAELMAGAFFLLYKPMYFRYALRYELTETGIYTSLPLIIHIPLKILFGHVSDRIQFISERMKMRIFNTIGVGFPALAYVGLAYAPTPKVATFFLILNGVFFAASGGGFFKCATLCSRQYSQFVIGNVQLCKCLALFVGPALVWIFVNDMKQQHQWRAIFLLYAALTTFANVLFCCVVTDQPLPFTVVASSTAPEARQMAAILFTDNIDCSGSMERYCNVR